MATAAFSAFTYEGRPLPIPPPSVESVDASDRLLVTARVVQQLKDVQSSKVRELLRDRKEVQRLLQRKDLPDGKGSAACDLDLNTHALGVACYLFMRPSAIAVQMGQCSTCESPASIGPMAQCVAEDLTQKNWIGGACTNCYYKGRGLQCSLRRAHEAAANGVREEQHQEAPEEEHEEGSLGWILAKARADFQKEAFSDNGVFGKHGPFSEERRKRLVDREDVDMDSDEDDLPLLVPDMQDTPTSESVDPDDALNGRSNQPARPSNDIPVVPMYKTRMAFREMQELGQEETFAERIPPDMLRQILEEVQGEGDEQIFPEDSFFGKILRGALPEDKIQEREDVDMDGHGCEDDGPRPMPDPDDSVSFGASPLEDAAMQNEQLPIHQPDWNLDIDMHRLAAMSEPPGSTGLLVADGGNGLDTGDAFIAKRPAQTDLRRNVSAKKQKQDS